MEGSEESDRGPLVQRNYLIHEADAHWVEDEAVRRSRAGGKRVSQADVVREAITAYREAQVAGVGTP